MAEVVLFHHAQGLTDGVRAFADRLRAAGHTVQTPDLYDGRTFDALADGLAYVEQLGGPDEILDRGYRSRIGQSDEVVYLGMSLGVLPAQRLVQTVPGGQGAILLHSSVPASVFGPWPVSVPVQVHAMDADPYFVDEGDLEAAQELVEQAPAGELFLYPGTEHLFTDSSLPAYDPAAAEQVIQRILAFLHAVDIAPIRPTAVELTLDCRDAEVLARFYRTALGYQEAPHPKEVAWLWDPTGRLPFLCLLEVPEPKSAKNRLHLDLVVTIGAKTPEQRWQLITDEVARLTEAGASVLTEYGGDHVTMADPEGNEFDVT